MAKINSKAKSKFNAKSFLQKLKGKRVLLLGHENSDLDAICSEVIFQEFLKNNKIKSVIGVPHHINDRAQNFCVNERISFQLNPNLREFDVIVLFDLNSAEQLGRLGGKFLELSKQGRFETFVFDHHVIEKNSLVKGKNAFVDDECVSTTQLLYNLLDGANHGFARPAKPKGFCSDINFNSRMFFLNCLGIVEDTGHFLTGDVASFSSFADSLKRSKKSFADVLVYAKHFVPADERMAFLKAAQRAEIIQIRGAIIVTSMVSFYQSAAASKLLSFGADVALVAGQEKNGVTTLSGRVNTDFREAHKFNLVRDLLIPLQKEFGGDCGGHSGAALWKGSADAAELLKAAVELLKKKI